MAAMPRPYTLARAAVTAIGLLDAAAAMAAGPTGVWLTEDGRARVRTEPCGPQGTSLCGYVVWVEKHVDENGRLRLDKENPDSQKRSRPVLGHQLFGLTPKADGVDGSRSD